MKKIIPLAIFIIIIALGVYFLTTKEPEVIENTSDQNGELQENQNEQQNQENNQQEQPNPEDQKEQVIGTSAEGNDITVYNYGQADTKVLFVGGIHGGYEWNTSLVAFQLMD